jgi:SAM-dependent methyltransferase
VSDPVVVDGGYSPDALGTRVKRSIQARGVRAVAGDLAREGTEYALGLPWSLRGSHGRFSFEGEQYAYLYHPYTRTWLTERAVEIPVVQRIVDRHTGSRILEVGNVLSHYRSQSHLVVDKAEHAPGVLNQDVLELDGLGPFDLIVAVSTLEHVGLDEHERKPRKGLEAARRLEGLLAPGGRLVITVPVGYNQHFDAGLRAGELHLSRAAALRRGPGRTDWRQVPPDEAWLAPYDYLRLKARAVLVATVERPSLDD